jgi:hypothetical protein
MAEYRETSNYDQRYSMAHQVSNIALYNAS